jgi:hypothetical protein
MNSGLICVHLIFYLWQYALHLTPHKPARVWPVHIRQLAFAVFMVNLA